MDLAREGEVLRDPEYLSLVRSFGCVFCDGPAEAHHLLRGVSRGLSRKSSDCHVLPLCRPHHQGLHDDGDETGYLARLGLRDAPGAADILYAARNDATSFWGVVMEIRDQIRRRK